MTHHYSFVPLRDMQRAPRPMVRALLTGVSLPDLIRIIADEAVSTLTKETAHAFSQALEREIDSRA